MSPYIIDEKNTSIFIDEMSNLISELEYPIKNTFKNITDEFLLNFQKGVNISEKNRKDVINTYKMYLNFRIIIHSIENVGIIEEYFSMI